MTGFRSVQVRSGVFLGVMLGKSWADDGPDTAPDLHKHDGPRHHAGGRSYGLGQATSARSVGPSAPGVSVVAMAARPRCSAWVGHRPPPSDHLRRRSPDEILTAAFTLVHRSVQDAVRINKGADAPKVKRQPLSLADKVRARIELHGGRATSSQMLPYVGKTGRPATVFTIRGDSSGDAVPQPARGTGRAPFGRYGSCTSHRRSRRPPQA